MLMEKYMDRLRQYVAEHQISFDEDTPTPCLEALWWHYAEHHEMTTPEVKRGFRDIRDSLSMLDEKACDHVIGQVGCLCAEHERIAFVAGLQLGVQLMLEITEGGGRDE